MKQLTTDSQLGAVAEEVVLARLEEVHGRVSEVLSTAAASAPRFAVYDERFSAALRRVRDGDAGALAKPMSGSYHDVWMELHEDLLAMLGEERTEADG